MSGKEYTARTIEEALERALNEMMLTRDDIEYEVVTQPAKVFWGWSALSCGACAQESHRRAERYCGGY